METRFSYLLTGRHSLIGNFELRDIRQHVAIMISENKVEAKCDVVVCRYTIV